MSQHSRPTLQCQKWGFSRPQKMEQAHCRWSPPGPQLPAGTNNCQTRGKLLFVISTEYLWKSHSSMSHTRTSCRNDTTPFTMCWFGVLATGQRNGLESISFSEHATNALTHAHPRLRHLHMQSPLATRHTVNTHPNCVDCTACCISSTLG